MGWMPVQKMKFVPAADSVYSKTGVSSGEILRVFVLTP
jgi:hypothetical protein